MGSVVYSIPTRFDVGHENLFTSFSVTDVNNVLVSFIQLFIFHFTSSFMVAGISGSVVSLFVRLFCCEARCAVDVLVQTEYTDNDLISCVCVSVCGSLSCSSLRNVPPPSTTNGHRQKQKQRAAVVVVPRPLPHQNQSIIIGLFSHCGISAF